MSDLIKRWQGNSARREVVMVTSGIDPLGGFGPQNPYLDKAIQDAQREGIITYAIYLPGAGHSSHSFYRLNWAQNGLAQLAEETGGEAYQLGFNSPVSIAPYLDEINMRLANQYRVTFLMKPKRKDAFREMRFISEVPNAELVAATRVYIPASGDPAER